MNFDELQAFHEAVPTHEAKIEQAVLGSMMTSERAIDIAQEMLGSDDFYIGKHREIFSTICDMDRAGVDELTVGMELRRRGIAESHAEVESEYRLSDMVTAGNAANVESYCSILKSQTRLRKSKICATRLTQSIQSGDLVAVGIIAKELSELDKEGAKDSSRSICELLDDPELLNPAPRVPTTFTALDEGLGGGWVARGMYTVGGLTGRGKSTLAKELARRAGLSGVPTLLITLEDDVITAVRKALASQASVPMRALENYQNPYATTEAERQRTTEAVAKLKTIPLWIDSTTTDLDQVARQITSHVENKGVRLVLVDQSSWVHDAKAETPIQDASSVARRLKTLAKTLKITVVVLVQINRAGAAAIRDGMDIELHHIRDSGRWEEDSDGVLLIQGVDEALDGALMRIDLKKNRHGKAEQRVYLRADLKCGLLDDSEHHLQPEDLSKRKDDDEDEADKWTLDRFVTECCTGTPEPEALILQRAREKGCKKGQAKDLFSIAKGGGKIFPLPGPVNATRFYSTVRPAVTAEPEKATRKPGRPRKNPE